MLTRLLPEQVSAHWDTIAPAIAESLPPMTAMTGDGMANILRSVLFDDLVVWVYYEKKNDEEFDAIYLMSTITHIDRVTMQRSLLIYSFTGLSEVKAIHFAKGYATLAKYAGSLDCNAIIAFTENEQIVKFFESKGANTNYTLIEMEV